MLNRSRSLNSTSNTAWIRAFDTATGKPKTGLTSATAGLVIYTSINGGAVASIGALAAGTEGTFGAAGNFVESAVANGLYQVSLPNNRYTTVGGVLLGGEATDDTIYFREELIDVTTDDAYAAGLTGTGIADAILNRDMATGTDSGSTTVRTVRQALRTLRNRFVLSAGTVTVYKEDDATESFTAVVTGTPAVTQVNPAGGS